MRLRTETALASRLLPLLLVTGALLVSCQPAQADAKTFEVWIVAGELQSESTLRASEGDSVEITYHSDTALELHLHGYDVETEVKPDIPATMKVDASSGGRFAIEAHGHGGGGHKTLLYLEVHPR